jgi:hypothetical protein
VSFSPSLSPSFQPPLAGFAAKDERAIVAVYAGEPCKPATFNNFASADCPHLIPLFFPFQPGFRFGSRGKRSSQGRPMRAADHEPSAQDFYVNDLYHLIPLSVLRWCCATHMIYAQHG